MKSKNTFSKQWDRGKESPSPIGNEYRDRILLINLVRGFWSDDLQDQVFLHDEPDAAVALNLVQKYGVCRAGRLILKMNE